MDARQRLRAAIDQRANDLRGAVPDDRPAAIRALIRAIDRLPIEPGGDSETDFVAGHRRVDLGASKALQLCLEADGAASGHAAARLDDWASNFLAACGRLAEAELVLAHCETGFMRLVDDGAATFDAFIAARRPPTIWRERADITWWASFLARRHEPELRGARAELADPDRDDPERAASYRRVADAHLRTMTYQLAYPPDAMIGDCSIQTCRDVLRWLIAAALQAHDRGEAPAPRSEGALIAAIAMDLDGDAAAIGQAVAALTIDRTNAAYHAAVPGVAAAPLVRSDADSLVWSVRGLTTEPWFFLTRELRRRDAAAYHNAAYLREGIFRQDLYALFPDKRFVTSAGRIALRRESGDVRTDIDAVVFDRKTGALGVFELKSQDPFARSTAELARQRDNLLYANRQLSGVLAWLQRHDADALVNRVDAKTAKTFRAHKVYPFVLGRYLARFDDGPPPDRRAAWASWPQVLRLRDGRPFAAAEANPLAWLFARLTNDIPIIHPPADARPREIDLGAARLRVYPNFAAFQAEAEATTGR
ncbi:MAG TPA: hypothetical protein VFI22_03240 [Thermomicrobiales bacterium]|nr:hypothetical protein [Thermomicrobiales bacterium]